MFGDSARDLANFLTLAERDAINRCRFNQAEALRELARVINQDRRFDDYDPDRLAQRVSDCRHSGRVLDLSDPELRPGGAVYHPLKRV
jgi:hypothetical protein